MDITNIKINNTFNDELSEKIENININETNNKTHNKSNNKNNEESSFDKNIINMSKYFWNMIKKKDSVDYCHFNFPLILIKNIDCIEDICAHIKFYKSSKYLEGLFYINSIYSRYSKSLSFIHDDTNSFCVNKDLYFTYNFYRTRIDYSKLKKENDKHQFNHFNNSIKSLFKNIIFKLKFDIFLGKFFIPNNEENNYLTSLFDVIESSDNIKSVGDICCVCHEKTATLTKCNHNLCVKCYSKIKKNNGENSICPLCRKYI